MEATTQGRRSTSSILLAQQLTGAITPAGRASRIPPEAPFAEISTETLSPRFPLSNREHRWHLHVPTSRLKPSTVPFKLPSLCALKPLSPQIGRASCRERVQI